MSTQQPKSGDPARELLIAKGKLNALSAIIKLGHEGFQCSSLQDWAGHVVNNSLLAIKFDRSSVIDLRFALPSVLAVTGQPEPKANSEYTLALAALAKDFADIRKITLMDQTFLTENPHSAVTEEAANMLFESSQAVYLVPIRPSGSDSDTPNTILWIVEFHTKDQAAMAPALLALLAEHYSESLFFILNERKNNVIKAMTDRSKWFRPSRIFLYIIVVFLLACILVRIPQKVSAEFEIIPEEAAIVYAPFDGTLEKCNFKNGDTINSGDTVLTYNLEERLFELANAKNEFNRITAQLNLAESAAFKDEEKRGQIPLLKLQQEKMQIDIDKNAWYVERGDVKAETSGILNIGDTDKLSGKAVRAGDLLFEVLNADHLIANIALDERYSSILKEQFEATLYLNTRPELPIASQILSVSPKPVLNEKRLFCYQIRVKPEINSAELTWGMRGTARLSGSRVSLGYYLFRNLVLWYRQL